MISLVACILGMVLTGALGFMAGLWLGLVKLPTFSSDAEAVHYKKRCRQLECVILNIRRCLPVKEQP